MLSRHALLSITLAGLLGACGGGESADGGESAAATPEPAAAEPVNLRVDVNSLPSPCDLLPPAAAARLLQVENPQQENLVNERAVARMCRYLAGEGEQPRYLSLQLSVVPATTMSSAHDSKQTLVARATEMAGGISPSAILEDLGVISFAFDSGDTSLVQVLTGMGGADPETGEPVSELIMGYSLSYPGMEQQQRSEALLQQARLNMSQLQGANAQ